MDQKNRNDVIDILKGLLIIMVVIGHCNDTCVVSHVIYLFHMPLFFIISGYLLKRERLMEGISYVRARIINLIVPYVVYLFIDIFLVRRDYALNSLIRALWGGRALSGVYWYITCFLFSLFLLSFFIRSFSDRMSKSLIILGGGIAIIESYLVGEIHLLYDPGIPWNLDVSLMAVVYVGIGFFYKDEIKKLLECDSKKYDLIARMIAIILILLCWFIYRNGEQFYHLDMKKVCYKEFISAISLPCVFGIIFVRLIHRMEKIDLLKPLRSFLIFCGQATIPIMFMHIPLNHWKDSLGYGQIAYIVIGLGIPLVFTLIFYKYDMMRKLFGLPKYTGLYPLI